MNTVRSKLNLQNLEMCQPFMQLSRLRFFSPELLVTHFHVIGQKQFKDLHATLYFSNI